MGITSRYTEEELEELEKCVTAIREANPEEKENLQLALMRKLAELESKHKTRALVF